MANKRVARDPRVYRVGIDVGTHSVGLAAVEVDAAGTPLRVLSAVSHIHDSGVLEHKTADTRLAVAGVARRMRRLRRRRVRRLRELDRAFERWGWQPSADDGDPYAAWRVRARLATEVIGDEDELHAHLVTALRHMARHRGWRNPYVRISSLYGPAEPSEFLVGSAGQKSSDTKVGFKQRVEEKLGRDFPPEVTVAELAVAAIDHDQNVPLRMGKAANTRAPREFSYLGGKLLQSDNANEIHAYARVQRLEPALVRELIDLVFASESPRGSWITRVGKDPLDGNPRAPKASEAFQRFRIVSVLATVRLRDNGSERRMSREELQRAFTYLVNLKPGDQPTWGDVGESLGLARRSLSGVAATDAEGTERLPARPPVLVTDHVIRGSKLRQLQEFWVRANPDERDAIVGLLLDGVHDEDSQAGVAAWELQESLSEEELAKLDTLNLPAGRAAYSLPSLRKLTERMLATGDDLHEARKAVFGIGDDWVPPAEAIGAPVGHPAVDRVLKVIARFLAAAEAEWGVPERVVIEHVRDAFRSEKAVRDADRENQQRFAAKLKQRESIGSSVKADGRVRDSDVRRFEAVQRQNSQCAYCGDTITFDTAELDHIVPRKGVGSTNTKVNLVAACVPCNRLKSSKPFSAWVKSQPPGVTLEGALERLHHWQRDEGMSAKSWKAFLREVSDRLDRTESDPEIDARSMESVAWMANEVRDRIDYHYRGSNVSTGAKLVYVYKGAVTADARRAAGIEGRIPWVGGGGKTRLDRRHHAVDAAVLTMIDDSVARTLAERMSLRQAERFKGEAETWKSFAGSSNAARERFERWKESMQRLAEVLAEAFHRDEVVVAESLRLRLANGKVHKDKIEPLEQWRVGDALSRDEIDAASTPQLWIALTRDPDYEPESGLPENPARRLRVQGQWYDAEDRVGMFDKPRAAMAVRGGWAALGLIHHARFYRWEERGKTKYGMLRVFSADLYRHRDEDLFSVPPHPSWISMRVAHKSIGRADLAEKQYLGWLVPGDEVLMSRNAPATASLGEIRRWRVTGFEDAARVNLLPRQLAAEGLDRSVAGADDENAARDLVGNARRLPVSSFLSDYAISVVRRDALGRPRWRSAAGLPVCWSAE